MKRKLRYIYPRTIPSFKDEERIKKLPNTENKLCTKGESRLALGVLPLRTVPLTASHEG